MHEHHCQAADAPGQEPLQLPTQAPQVHGLLHLQQVPCTACQEAIATRLKACQGLLPSNPNTGGTCTFDGRPGSWLPTIQHHTLVHLQHLFVQHLGHGHGLGASRGSGTPWPERPCWGRGGVPTGQSIGPEDREVGKAHPASGSLPKTSECGQ